MGQETYLVLARKWRPQHFEEVVGQDHITRPLQNSLRSGRIAHAYLFIGTRGVGKTTTARLLAKALNCLSSSTPTPQPCGTCENCRTIAAGNNIDVIEIDGASNNKVEDVREIREHIGMVPSSSRYKIYIIDEVHQLSSSAFNALLKTLEEPPAHAVFILATTEAHKVPPTIVSRCQRYDFRRVGVQQVKTMLRRILDAEGVRCSDEALHAIARAADGSIRDAESILEQIISYSGEEITFQDVFDVLGLVDWQTFHDLCDALLEKDIKRQLVLVDDVVSAGKDLSQFLQDILQYFRNLLVCKTAENAVDLLALPEEEVGLMRQRAERFKLTDLIRIIEQFSELSRDFHAQLGQRILLEATLIRLSKVAVEVSLDTVMEKLIALGAGGILPSTSSVLPNPRRAVVAEPSKQAAAADESVMLGDGSSEGREEKLEEKIFATGDNLRGIWTTLTHRISRENLALAVALGHGVAEIIEGETLVVGFSPDHDRSLRAAQREESVVLVERFLAELTVNLRHIRCVRSRTPEKADGNGSHGQSTAANDGIPAELMAQVTRHPGVATVLHVFKGRIVAVRDKKRSVSPAEKEDASE